MMAKLKRGHCWIHKRCSGIRGNLSLVADDFSCKLCDGTIQGADLDWDLVVDGETYGCVKCFCYLGSALDGHGGADLAATAIIINEWMKFRELFSISDISSSPARDERLSVCQLCQK